LPPPGRQRGEGVPYQGKHVPSLHSQVVLTRVERRLPFGGGGL